jgi:hypothetical protein
MQGGVWTWSSISTQVGSYFFFYVSFGRIPFFKKILESMQALQLQD